MGHCETVEVGLHPSLEGELDHCHLQKEEVDHFEMKAAEGLEVLPTSALVGLLLEKGEDHHQMAVMDHFLLLLRLLQQLPLRIE